ncbi:adenylyltransferase/cytidyltransferase family protein [Nocardioides sp.]|uniref:adenylyltransferase/cytidyltransferase family protein n=1 Tax=Nocardioides sp. TaxID=35761 RepID=UPI0039E43DA1
MGAPTPHSGTARVYVDVVGDLFHAGHVELLRAARALGGYFIVGVLADETAQAYKRRPIMTLAERVAVVEACRYVDEVIIGAPFQVDEGFLSEHDIDVVVHGDDLGRVGKRGHCAQIRDAARVSPAR